jgi:hypothetical protein
MFAVYSYIMKSLLTLFVFSMMLTLHLNKLQAQARSGLGIGAALNVSEQQQGYGGFLYGEIKVAPAVSIVPAIGLEIPHGAYFSLKGRYYPKREVYVNAGPLIHLGSLEGGDSGVGGSIGLGLSPQLSKRTALDVSLHLDLIHMSNVLTPVYGLRLAFEGIF